MNRSDAEGAAPTALAVAKQRAALRRCRAVSRVLDDAVRVPGTRFRVGLDPVLGILPVGGDLLAMALSLYPVLEAARLGLPRSLLARMLAVVLLDATIGSIPVVGPVFDAVLKANRRNVRLLERHLG